MTPGTDSAPSKSGRTRRSFLAAAASTVAATATGCLGGGGREEDLPEPIALDAGQSCDECGMIIRDHPGPAGQTYYAENTPEGRDEGEPAQFCSLVCLFDFYYAKRGQGWKPLVHYVTDYSAVDYEVRQQGPSLFLSAHLGADSFADGERTTLVVDSEAKGAMGPSLVPFIERGDAMSFQEEYGGEVLGFGEVSRQLVDSL